MTQPPQAFAIGFGQRDAFDELRSARTAAAALGVPLLEVQADEAQYRQEWLSSSMQFGEPVANSGMLLVAMLCRRVRETHKVVLSGQGADEPLGGYPRHTVERWYPVLRRLRWLIGAVPERWAQSDRVSRTRRVVAEPDRARRFAEILAVFSPREVERLTGRSCAERLTHPVQSWLSRADRDDTVNALLYVDARLSLADDLLLIADQMSMASSVELRVPFLDLELLALFERMPSRYKTSWTGARKWMYRHAVRGLVPPVLQADVLGWRARTGRKLGFTTPLSRWAKGWGGDTAVEFLTGRDAVVPQFVRVERLRDFMLATRGRAHERERQLAALFVMETWLRGVRDGRQARHGASALTV
jgi:asparagine synthase (glutamine-hydrolysing)